MVRSTVRDVAREAGVSHRTVVNVLNGRHRETSAATRERVLETARRLNYIPVAQPATQRRHVETRILGLVFDRVSWGDYWGMQTFEGLREGALEYGYDLLTILRESPDWSNDKQHLQFLDRRSDGIIFMAPRSREEAFRALLEHRIPAVSCYLDDVPEGVACVTVDNQEAMRKAVAHLVSKGHERILYAMSAEPRSDFGHRLAGYISGMQRAGLMPIYEMVDMNTEWAQRVLAPIKQRNITAVLCASDAFAIIMHEILRSEGYRVPEDISLVGMDDIPASAELGLTTVRISGADVGRLAVDAMVNLIQGKTAAESFRVAPCELVSRTTVASPGH